jgi:hypothetical protein
VKGLRGCRAAAPHGIKCRALIRDFRPALACQVPDFRAPIGKGYRLDADKLLLKRSCQIRGFLSVGRQVGGLVPTRRFLDCALRISRRRAM